MKIFADRHHSSLANSLHLLFENRLNAEVYFPIGLEWADEGWWKIAEPYGNDPGTIKQYLQIQPEYKPMDGTVPLNHIVKETPTHYEVEDLHEHYVQKAITLEQFQAMDIDIIIASIPAHWESFTKLRDRYKPKAKVICQMGNHFVEIGTMISRGIVKNLMASTAPFPISYMVNSVFYHQEFDTKIFKPSSWPPEKLISSFINVYPKNGGSIDYYSLKAAMPEYQFESYGGGCDDGGVVGVEMIARTMILSQFGFHSKYGGDGFGHILYNWLACGRPVITRLSQYKGKLGEELLENMVTAIDLDVYNYEEVRDILINMNPDKYLWMCGEAHLRFNECVNYAAEEMKIREFLDKLL